MGHRITVLNNAANAKATRARKAQERGNKGEAASAKKEALRDVNTALRLNEVEKKRLNKLRRQQHTDDHQ